METIWIISQAVLQKKNIVEILLNQVLLTCNEDVYAGVVSQLQQRTEIWLSPCKPRMV